MKDLTHLLFQKYVTDTLRDFTEDLEDLDETICALCGLSPDKCPCYKHPPHSCEDEECPCPILCSCCEVKICSCGYLDVHKS
jgi:hypothetical protein